MRRGCYEVKMSILEQTVKGIHKPTNIMKAEAISWNRMWANIKNLIKNGCLEIINSDEDGRSKRLIIPTQKGREITHHWITLRSLMEETE